MVGAEADGEVPHGLVHGLAASRRELPRPRLVDARLLGHAEAQGGELLRVDADLQGMLGECPGLLVAGQNHLAVLQRGRGIVRAVPRGRSQLGNLDAQVVIGMEARHLVGLSIRRLEDSQDLRTSLCVLPLVGLGGSRLVQQLGGLSKLLADPLVHLQRRLELPVAISAQVRGA
eukprot:scaffold264_cov317-Pinguiococcus_pyrenoidosus.AAC.10